jgi:hypothetical protein
VGSQCLFRVITHKRAILADPEAKGDDAAEVTVAVALVRLHLGYTLADGAPVGCRFTRSS